MPEEEIIKILSLCPLEVSFMAVILDTPTIDYKSTTRGNPTWMLFRYKQGKDYFTFQNPFGAKVCIYLFEDYPAVKTFLILKGLF